MTVEVQTDSATMIERSLSGIGIVMDYPSCRIHIRREVSVPCDDNNLAEYAALLLALSRVLYMLRDTPKAQRRVKVFSDSQIMVKQMTGEYRCHVNTNISDKVKLARKIRLAELNAACLLLSDFFEEFEIVYRFQEEGNEADGLARSALGRQRKLLNV
jgi:ribonuclease HI